MAGYTSQTSLSGGVAVAPYSAFSGINAVTGANYTILDTDGYSDIHVTTGASDRTMTLPAAANNSGRRIRFLKVDSGVGGVALSGTISGSSSNNTIKAQYGRAEIISDGSAWYWSQDIEESGTWTPSSSFTTSQGSTVDSAASGWYRRSGRLISYGGLLTITDGSDTASGALRVAGLPYTSSVISSGSSRIEDRTTAPANYAGSYSYIAGSTTLILFYWLPTAGGTSSAITAAHIGTSGADIVMGGSYPIA